MESNKTNNKPQGIYSVMNMDTEENICKMYMKSLLMTVENGKDSI